MRSGRCRVRTQRKLASLRGEIAQAKCVLADLVRAIGVSRSDESLEAMEIVRAENERLLAKDIQATKIACANQVALRAALNASQTDPLTGLLNRTVLIDRVTHEMEKASRLRQFVGVLLLDLDEFKSLNDQFGHALGDLVLQRVATALAAAVRASDTVCRLGGDEFVVVASTAAVDDVAQLAKKLAHAIAEPVLIAGHLISLSVSVGTSVFPGDAESAEALIEVADHAMYRVKRAHALILHR